jgi:Cu(I)/Ag(I) efflux system membrane fusion protein
VNGTEDQASQDVQPSPGVRTPSGVRVAAVVRWALVTVMGAAALLSALYVAGVLHRGAAGGQGGGGAGASVLYQCPMHPQVVRDRPGDCPICGMTLVPKDGASGTPAASAAPPAAAASAVPGLAPVDLTPERIQLAGLKTAKVVRRPLRSELKTVGVVTPSERGLAQINTRFAGWIQELFVPETGRRVKRGDRLATIYSPDVLAAEQEYLTARRWAAGAPAPTHDPAAAPAHQHDAVTAGMADDARKRLDLLGVAAQEIDEITRTGQALRAVTIRSPVSGTVIRRGAVAGTYVQPGSELFAIADLTTVWVMADVYEHEVARIRPGQAARLELAAYPGETIAGRVQFLYPAINPETRTMRVRIEVRNAAGKLSPGMYATVRIDLPGAEGLVVPPEAVVDTGEAQYLFVAREGGRFEPRRIAVGARSDAGTEIRAGVSEGETVVTTGNFLVDSESRLRAAVEGRR